MKNSPSVHLQDKQIWNIACISIYVLNEVYKISGPKSFFQIPFAKIPYTDTFPIPFNLTATHILFGTEQKN